MNLLIDPGHGGQDPGACAHGLREADYVLAAGRMLMEEMRRRRHVAHLTRDNDDALGYNKNADLTERCRMERSWKPGLFVSLHCNAAMSTGANGFEVWTSPGQTRSDVAAEEIVEAFARHYPGRLIRRDLTDGDSDKESKFRVLTGTLGAAVLVEMGFITNAVDAAWLKQNLVGIVKALADGIEAFAAKGA